MQALPRPDKRDAAAGVGLHHAGDGRHGGGDDERSDRTSAPHHRRASPLRPPQRLHGMREGGRLHPPGAGLLLRPPREPLLRRAETVHEKGPESLHPAGHGEVHPLRKMRARLRRSAGRGRHRHLKPRLYGQGLPAVRKRPRLRVLRPVRQSLSDGRAHGQRGAGQRQAEGCTQG